jgi:REP element-mobilizing transposase RayT
MRTSRLSDLHERTGIVSGRVKSRQRSFVFKTWGGKRKGAGRKRKTEKRRVPHTTRPRLNGRTPVHLTLRMCPHIRRLRKPDQYRAIRKSLARTAYRSDFRIVHFSIQSNHVHLICEPATKEAMSRGMMAFKSSVAKRLNALAGLHGRVFADRYHARYLVTAAQVRAALSYVLNNWRRHREDRGTHWSIDHFSSGEYFDGWQKHEATRVPMWGEPVAAARFWLLTTGWRHHGAIGEREIPGTRA